MEGPANNFITGGKQAHTPWEFRVGKLPRTVSFKRKYWEVGVRNAKGIAIVFGDDETNVRLVTAAPDLLAALDNIIPRFERCIAFTGTDPEFVTEATKDARAAIAKATGGAP